MRYFRNNKVVLFWRGEEGLMFFKQDFYDEEKELIHEETEDEPF